jgi:hypothetical protein
MVCLHCFRSIWGGYWQVYLPYRKIRIIQIIHDLYKLANTWQGFKVAGVHLQGPRLQVSRIPGFFSFQDSRITWFQDVPRFFLTPLPQEIETQQNRCWEVPALWGIASPLSKMQHDPGILPKSGASCWGLHIGECSKGTSKGWHCPLPVCSTSDEFAFVCQELLNKITFAKMYHGYLPTLLS